ncbi:MAG: hypothetical protein Q9221_000206 [Calogaya cf. arnoldii]
MDPPSPSLDLLGLPNEILLRIIEYETRHKDFENFTSCCKTIFRLAKLARERHLKRKQKFSTFIVGDLHVYNGYEEPVVPRKVHPVFALRELLADKDTAVDYCQTLKFGGVNHGGFVTSQYEDGVAEEALSITQKLEPQLEALIGEEPFSDFSGSYEWIEKQIEGTCDLPFAIPLNFLHNITVLELVNCSEFLQELDRDPWGSHSVCSELRESHHHLKEIRLFGNHDGGGEVLEVLASFVDIPSVRRLHGFHITADSNQSDYDPSVFSRFRKITGIHFECSSIDSEYFEKLLCSIEALEDFYYEHNSAVNDEVLHNDQQIICGLENHARKSLQTLTYLDSSSESAGDFDDSTYLPSLHDFSVLRHVAIDYSTLLPRHAPDCDPDDSKRMYKLVDMMPSTLETLEVYGPISSIEAASMFGDLRERKEERLPKLRKISMKRNFDLDQKIQDDCKELGIDLAVVDQPNKKYPHQDY